MPPKKIFSMTPALLGVSEFAAMIGISRVTLWQWLKLYPEQLPRPVALAPGKEKKRSRRYFRRADVEAWLAAPNAMKGGRV